MENFRRNSRRLPATPVTDSEGINAAEPDNAQPTFRSRGSRQREEAPREVTQTRSRSRSPTERTPPTLVTETPTVQGNEQFQSRRTRTRRPVENKTDTTFTPRDNERVRSSQVRQTVRRRPTSTTTTTTTTQAPVEVTSSKINATKPEDTNIDDIAKITTKEDNTLNTANTATTQFRRRSFIAQTTETVAVRRNRGRVNVRPNARSLDLDDSGTTNSIVVVDKAPTTAKTSADLRNARKLRYSTRLSETDSNLTGEGITTLNEVKPSQKENFTSHSETEMKTSAPVIEKIVQESTEANKLKTTTLKVTKVVRRPLVRRKADAKLGALSKLKSAEIEISEDDNYPESFKALIQAKNAVSTAR